MSQTQVERKPRKRAQAQPSSGRISGAGGAVLTRLSPDVVLLIGGDGAIEYVSPACHTMLGYAPEAMLGTRADLWAHPDDAPALLGAWADLRERGGGRPIVARLRRSDGGWVRVEAMCRAPADGSSGGAPGSGGRIMAICRLVEGRSRDVDDEERTPTSRRDGDAALDHGAAFTHAAVGLLVVRAGTGAARGRIIEANGALGRVLGEEPAALGGRRLEDLLEPGESGEEAATVLRAVLEGRARKGRVETGLVRADGGVVCAVVTASLCDGSEDEGGAVVVTVEDVTERLAVQRRASELEAEFAHVSRLALAGELAAVLAHEVNQPLTAIANYVRAAATLLERSGEGGEAAGHLRCADAEAKRAVQVVRSLAGFVRRGESRPCECTLEQIVSEISGMIRAAAGRTPVEIDLSDGGERVCADRVQVQQVVLNLVRNAAEATGACGEARGGIVVRACSPEAGWAELSVTDGGRGLAPGVAERLFSPFFTTKAQGMGMGLTICRSIIEAHGGRMWGENNPPPSPGATFRFRLPVYHGEASYDG